MTQVLILLAVALTFGMIVFGVAVLLSGDDEGMRPVEPDGVAVPLPRTRPLIEADVQQVRFDTAVRGYRMAQVDAALRRVAYDIGYKDELVKVLQAEVDALREGRFPDAEVLRRAREASAAGRSVPTQAQPAAGIDPPQVEPPEAGVEPPEVDPPEVDPPEADPPDFDRPEVEQPDVDAPDIEPPDVDRPDVKEPPPDIEPPDAGAAAVEPAGGAPDETATSGRR